MRVVKHLCRSLTKIVPLKRFICSLYGWMNRERPETVCPFLKNENLVSLGQRSQEFTEARGKLCKLASINLAWQSNERTQQMFNLISGGDSGWNVFLLK